MRSFIMTHKKEISFVFAMFCIFFPLSLIIPFDNAPDESSRYLIAQYIAKHNALPLGTDAEVRIAIWGASYAFSPYLSYMLSSVFMMVASIFTDNNQILLISARFSNVICSTITICFIIAISGKVFGKNSKWIFIALFSTFPCFIFVSSYVNCDALALTSGSIITYSWIIGMNSNWNNRSCILLIIGLSLCILSYQNAYGYVLLTVILFLYELYRNFKTRTLSIILKKGLIIFGAVTVLGGWFYIRNYIVYDGDWLGIKTSEKQAEIYADRDYKPSNKKSLKEQGVSLKEMLFDRGWLETTYKSFVGVFGNMTLNMPSKYYSFYNFIFIVGIISILLSLNRWKFFNVDDKVLYSLLFFATIIPICLTIYYSYFRDYQPQGRYALSLLLPLTLILSKGIVSLMNRYIPKQGSYVAVFITITLLLTSFAIMLDTFFTAYLI